AGIEQAFEAVQPQLVVARVEVLAGRQPLAHRARLVDVPLTEVTGGKGDGERATLPGVVERRLVRLDHDWPEPVHAAEVVEAVHPAPAGACATATPIIESRVTRPVSSASDIASVPAGRSGSTMYLISAVLSQTRTSRSSGTPAPSSLRTPRGSITARARYGADLYQIGGRPRPAHG